MKIAGKYILSLAAAYIGMDNHLRIPGEIMKSLKNLLAAIIAFTLLDVGLTYWGIMLAGTAYEQNPVVLWIMERVGCLPGLGVVCLWTIACAGLILAISSRHKLKWGGRALCAVAGIKGLIVVSHTIALSGLLV